MDSVSCILDEHQSSVYLYIRRLTVEPTHVNMPEPHRPIQNQHEVQNILAKPATSIPNLLGRSMTNPNDQCIMQAGKIVYALLNLHQI